MTSESASPGAPSRRRFLRGLGLASIATATLGCERRRAALIELPNFAPDASSAPESASADEPRPQRSSAADRTPFRTIEAAGPPEELGAQLGQASAEAIRRCMEADRAYLESLRAFVEADRAARLDPFVQATERHHPEVMAELRGIARGAGLPLDDVLIWNLQPELGALRASQPRTPPGCSTLHLMAGDRLLLAHNEDGADLFRQEMLILRLRPEGKPSFVSLGYPGQIPGQVPAINSAGLVVSTNFIGTREVRPGMPRYVLGRAVHGCSTVDQALAVATNPDRAFAFTLNLGSTRERRLVCLELTPGAQALREAEPGLFVHTNHLVLPATRGVPQGSTGPSSSTGSRYQVLTEAAREAGDASALDGDDLIRLLSSHQAVAQPYSPCRHPVAGGSQGRTLATALFDVAAGAFTLFEGNPCEGRRRVLERG